MVVEPGRVFEALCLFVRLGCVVDASLWLCCGCVVAVLFVAEQNVRTVVVTSACLLACSLSLCLCLLPVVVVVLQQLPFPVWRSGLLLFLLFRIAPGVLPFSMQFFALCRSHVVEFDFLFSLISLTISTPRSGLSHELASRVFLC